MGSLGFESLCSVAAYYELQQRPGDHGRCRSSQVAPQKGREWRTSLHCLLFPQERRHRDVLECMLDGCLPAPFG